jgi:hypothetical protein
MLLHANMLLETKKRLHHCLALRHNPLAKFLQRGHLLQTFNDNMPMHMQGT